MTLSRGSRRFRGECFSWVHLSSSNSHLGGVSMALSPSLSRPQHPPSLSLNHSDPAHLEPMSFSILSSTVVISNQPICVSLSPHQQPALLLISAWSGRRRHHSALEKRQKCCFVHPELSELCLFCKHHLHSIGSHAFTPDRSPNH